MPSILSCLYIFLTIGGFYDQSLPLCDGALLRLSEFKGKKVLLVNIASNSRDSLQISRLNELQRRYEKRLVIVAIPSNSFCNEPLDAPSIRQWRSTHAANLIVTGKVVVSGASQISLFRWLNYPVLSDYQKFLIDEKGAMIGVFSAATDPLDPGLQNTIDLP